jgi:hypothetical protein
VNGNQLPDVDVTPHLARTLAKDVLICQALGGMPDTFWMTDTRTLRACVVLGVSPVAARRWARWRIS